MRPQPLLLAVSAAALTAACATRPETAPSQAAERPAVARASASAPTSATPAEAGPPRYRRWSPRIGQGAQPRGPADFQALADDGYQVILSVDGALTDVATAQRYGLRYIHVPIGYDGVDRDEAAAIVKAVTTAEGPVYVHCHHGQHRGPTAAALARIVVDHVSNQEAVRGLLLTLSPAYPGLRHAVETFVPPTEEELAQVGPLQSQVHPTDLVAHMLDIDERWDHVQTAQEHGWQPDPQHPDVEPRYQARLLLEALKETARLQDEVARMGGAPFEERLDHAIQTARTLEQTLAQGDLHAADRAATRVKASCTACHTTFRN